VQLGLRAGADGRSLQIGRLAAGDFSGQWRRPSGGAGRQFLN